MIAWAAGILASALGLAASYVLDLPTGAAMVAAFGLALLLAGLVKALVFVDEKRRRTNVRIAARGGVSLALLLVLASSVWLIANPAGDQPLASFFETATRIGSAGFLDASERETYDSAARDMVRFQTEVDRLNAMERAARYEGASLSDDDIRRIASYQQSFNEMTRGERFVQDVLRAKARTRERWIVGLPFAVLALIGLGMLARRLI